MTEDESDSALVDGDADSLVEDVRAMGVTPVETEAGSDSSINVDLCQVVALRVRWSVQLLRKVQVQPILLSSQIL